MRWCIVSVLFQMIWRSIVGGANDPEDVTPCESEDAAMADLHEFGIQLKKWPRGPVKSERY